MNRFALLLCLCLAGCVGVKHPVPPAPEPEPEPTPVTAEATIDGLTSAFNARLRAAYLQGAANLRSGKWKTDKQYLDGQTALIDEAFDAAAQPLADREQRQLGSRWDPKWHAAYLEKIAAEDRP